MKNKVLLFLALCLIFLSSRFPSDKKEAPNVTDKKTEETKKKRKIIHSKSYKAESIKKIVTHIKPAPIGISLDPELENSPDKYPKNAKEFNIGGSGKKK